MAQIAGGDAHAFERLVEARLDRIVATARRLLGNDAEAEEVAQDAFLRLWRNAADWQPGRARISTWLYRVTSNLAIDRLRSRRVVAVEEVPEVPIAPRQARGLEEEALAGTMQGALAALPDRQRQALVLFHYEELSMAEVADIMDASVDAVESLLARGRRSLKAALRDSWKDLLPEDVE